MPSAADEPVGHPPGCAAPTPGGEPGEEGCIEQSTAGSTAHTAAAVEAKSAALPAAAPSVHCSSLSVVLGQAEVEQELNLGTRLGAGTFGTVFQGTWRGMQVAVKRLVFSGLAGDLRITGQRQQVLREAELNTRLAHPHLVATYAYYLTTLDTSSSSSSSQASPMLPGWPSQGQGVTDHALYLVSELCEHGSLLQAIEIRRLWDEQRQLPHLGLILTMLRDIAEAMDLKPDNVLLQTTPQGVVAKVADLGLGAIMRAEHSHHSGERVGTRLYSAPEVLQGRTSPAGDVYSFGVLAWELLHGCTAWARLLQIASPTHAPPSRNCYTGWRCCCSCTSRTWTANNATASCMSS
ncbi:kinase-like domain-containing protein [Haematococcus lacustris]